MVTFPAWQPKDIQPEGFLINYTLITTVNIIRKYATYLRTQTQTSWKILDERHHAIKKKDNAENYANYTKVMAGSLDKSSVLDHHITHSR